MLAVDEIGMPKHSSHSSKIYPVYKKESDWRCLDNSITCSNGGGAGNTTSASFQQVWGQFPAEFSQQVFVAVFLSTYRQEYETEGSPFRY
jgi:hypothetical protein